MNIKLFDILKNLSFLGVIVYFWLENLGLRKENKELSRIIGDLIAIKSREPIEKQNKKDLE